MSTKLPWTRLFADKWAIVVDYLPAVEGNIYMRLRLRMLRTGEPLFYNIKVLSHYTGYSVKKFEAALNVLLEEGYLIRLADGRLWNLDVEEELNNSNENLDKASEKASKAAKARWDKNKDKSNDDARAMHEQCTSNAYAMLNDAININNNNNNNKKNKNIILSKREIDFENLETNDLVEKAIECDVESQSEQIKTIENKQPIIHEQNINLSNEANNRWQINEAMIAKLPSRKVKKVGKKLSEIFDTMMPAYFPEKANFFEETKKTREKQEVKRILEDFKPDFQYAIEQGLTHDEALSEFEKFVRFSKSHPCRNANERDWQSAWDNWITHPEYGLVIKKHKKLETEKLYATACYKSSTNNFANKLSESFRNREAISSFANAC
ncbi:hypothetical protein Bgr_07720 [Bartonella grahamii as4aup]|uniref:Phage related protein n=1 Tax=Bartonella grahamii (strain as4aup) TaxID=634504 RepID=C6AD09_BARGA|nr:DUF1376 domain-containing protein [Bartonella grahamii]ACS51071.1 hypothetical protein Bgr_07720 [Bartonella grahamii as4aup]